MGSLADVDLTDLDNFAAGFPHHLFERHRAEAPVYWHEPTEHTPGAEGFWSVATHTEVLHVLKDPVTYSSERGGDRPYGGTLLQDLPVSGVVLNMTDDPRHARIRRLVSKGLTPRTVLDLEGELRRRAGLLLDALPDGEPVDVLVEVAAELPMQMICILLGVPETDHPDQLDALRKDPSLLPSAIEEVLRWTTPSPSKRRTATVATTLAGTDIAPGDKVLIWEGSANRDERVFDESMSFDIRRHPNPHLGFGHGVHFCLGANLAKLEMRVLYEELLPRFRTVEAAGPIEWTRSNRHTGMRHQPLVLRR